MGGFNNMPIECLTVIIIICIFFIAILMGGVSLLQDNLLETNKRLLVLAQELAKLKALHQER